MNNTKKLMFMAVIMAASMRFIEAKSSALPACSINIVNSTGYPLLQVTYSQAPSPTITQVASGASFTSALTGMQDTGYHLGQSIELMPSGGAMNYGIDFIRMAKIGKTCPAAGTTYTVSLDANNMIKVVSSAS